MAVAGQVDSVVVLDFDGTCYRGEAPVRRYAQEIATSLTPAARAGYLAAMDRFLGGGGGVDAADGWEAAVVLAGGPRGASDRFAAAFAATRRFMLEADCPLEVPPGLVEVLDTARAHARTVLASNTPAGFVLPLLERLQLTVRFDELVCQAGKPQRFGSRLRCLAEVQGVAPGRVLSIGDHFVNDIAPALEAGCPAAYLDPFGVGPRGRATVEAAQLEGIIPWLRHWLAGAADRSRPAGGAVED